VFDVKTDTFKKLAYLRHYYT